MLKEKELLYIEETAWKLKDRTIARRRCLHRMPETAWQEVETTEYLAQELQSMGFRVTKGEAAAGHTTGVIAEIGSEPSFVAAARFDIDALPVTETESTSHLPFAEGFRSLKDGRMHACGHDGHMAAGLACAEILSAYRDKISGTVRLIFQPAEEGCMGAREVVKKGWLEDVDYFLAGHIVGREYGQTAAGPSDCVAGVFGSMATTKIDASFFGQSAHAAYPEKGASAIAALCSAVTALNGIPRNSGGSTMLNIGKISGGEGRNIIAPEAEMQLEVRGETTELNDYMEERALQIMEASAAMHGCTSRITIQGKAPSLVSSSDFHKEILRLLKPLKTIKTASSGERFRASEDAALMMEAVKQHDGKAAFLLFPTDTTAPLHSRDYDFDESILPKAAAVFSCILLNLLL